MKFRIILLFLLVSMTTGTTAQQVDCANISIDKDTFHLYLGQDSIASANVIYLDTTAVVYPILRMLISDTTNIVSTNDYVLTFLHYPTDSIEPFIFTLKFKSQLFTTNTIVNGQFHIYDSDLPGDTIASCYIPVYFVLHNTTGFKETNNSIDYTCFPNPSQSTVTITFKELLHEPVDIKLYNSIGTQVFETSHNKSQNVVIDISHHAKGNYILKLVSGSKVVGSELLLFP